MGIGIDAATQSVAEERIYQAGFLRLRPGIGYCVEVDVPEGGAALIPLPGATVALGGEARRASVGVVDRPRWPTVPSGPDRRVSVLLTTPALLPLRLGAGHVVAALEGPREPYSGWDLARGGPKPTRFAAPAGSVYFLEGGDPPSDSVCDEEHARAGWGGVVLGRWAHAGG